MITVERAIAGLSGETVFDRVAGNPVVGRVARRALSAPLRVLAFHDIVDAAGFRAQMEHVVERYQPVSSDQVVAWVEGGRLPPGAVWVTFDDGDPSVVDDGLPILTELGIPATLFICPGLVGTTRPFWWQVAALVAPDEVAGLKVMVDQKRRRRVLEMLDRHETETRQTIQHRQLSVEDISRWTDAGNDIGNHTWDHPILDQCDPEEQERQVKLAHEWIIDVVRPSRLLFAYPNGNRTDHAGDVVAGLGYPVALLFDHAAVSDRTREMSRLRTNADDEIARFRAILSGIHPLVHRLRGRS